MDNENVEVPILERKLLFPDEVKKTLDSLGITYPRVKYTLAPDTQPRNFLKLKLAELEKEHDPALIRDMADEIVNETSPNQRNKLFFEFLSYRDSPNASERVFANQMFDTMLRPLGLDLSITQRWVAISAAAKDVKDPYLKQSKAIAEFMPSVLTLEYYKPGVVKYYVDNLNMNCFGHIDDALRCSGWYKTLSRTKNRPGEDGRQKWRRIVDKSLRELGISADSVAQMFTTWSRCSLYPHPFLSVSRNIDSLFEVYKKASDETTVKVLVEEFGIHNFSRYDAQTLIQQFEHKDELGDFGLVVYPKSDWKESFTYAANNLSKLAKDSTELGVNLRIVEVGNISELVTRVGKLVRKSQGKISYMVLGGHGTINDIQLGGNPWVPGKREVMTLGDVLKPQTPLFRRWFVDNPSVVLDSCSTGGEAGIAEQLSRQLDAQITAPNKPSSIRSIRLLKDPEGRLDLRVDYYHESHSVEYHTGKRV